MSEPTDNVHAGLVSVGGAGVLVLGAARSGKSSLAVSLVRGALREGLFAALVADDRVILQRRGPLLFGRSPASIEGLIELSGIGILQLATRREAQVTLVAELGEAGERLPEESEIDLLGLRVPRLRLPVRQAPFAADLVLTVLAAGEDSRLVP